MLFRLSVRSSWNAVSTLYQKFKHTAYFLFYTIIRVFPCDSLTKRKEMKAARLP